MSVVKRIESACPMRIVRIRLQLCLLLILIGRQPVFAQYTDEVVQRGSTPGSRMTVRCQIIDYTGSTLTVQQPNGGKPFEIKSSDVITIRTAQTTAHKTGIKAFDEGANRDAEFQFTEAIKTEPRVWMRRQILTMLVRCALKRNDDVTAATRFQLLFESDPETTHMNLIPLLWDDAVAEGESREAAIGWLKDEKPIAKLLAASWLFFDPEYSETSLAVFNELARTPPERIRQLANWQRRRLQIRSKDVIDSNLQRWSSSLTKLEPSLRPGPYYLLGRGYIVRQDFEMAAATFLKVPLIHDSEHPLSAQCLLETGRALGRIGLRGDAAKLYSEIIERYSYAAASRQAREELDQLTAKTAN
ncbi:MAG: tetratricopeptide repeat protein [Planctomycetales bacterium]